MLVILALFSGLVAKVAMPTLGAILIFAAIGSLRPGEVVTIWRTGLASQIAVVTTFAATLFLPGRAPCRPSAQRHSKCGVAGTATPSPGAGEAGGSIQAVY
jgi:hypothetical protein